MSGILWRSYSRLLTSLLGTFILAGLVVSREDEMMGGDVDGLHDEFAHIGDVRAAPNNNDENDDDVVIEEVYNDFVTTAKPSFGVTDLIILKSTSSGEDGVRRSMHRSHDYYFDDANNNDTNRGEDSYGSSIAHVYGGLICLPATYEYAIDRDTVSSSDTTSNHPTFAIGQSTSSNVAAASSSSVTLYALFPPPPIVMSSSYDSSNDDAMINSLNNARRQLNRQKGIHLAGVGITSVTTPTRRGRWKELGYSNAMISFGYRIPSLIHCWPTKTTTTTTTTGRQRRRMTRRSIMIGDLHYNIYTGTEIKSYSMGTTLTTLDGRTRLHFDMSDPISKHRVPRDCTFFASHDFGRSPLSLRADCTARLTTGQHRRSNANMNIFQHFNVSLSTRNSGNMTSLRLGYGVPQSIVESSQWMTNPSQQRDNIISSPLVHYHNGLNNISASTLHSSACVKIDIERHLHPSTRSCCRGSIEYLHAGQIVSFETMLIRSFSSSNFSRSGVGIRHSFVGWTRGTTFWLFQLERGGVRFLVPVSIIPSNSSTVWDSLIGLCYASLVSIGVDMIVSELLCGVTSRLRLYFLKLLLGSKRVDEIVSIDEVHTNELKDDKAENDRRLLQERLSNAKNDALRQVQLMTRQANIIAKKEDERGGLVIVKALYGVMDSNTRQWIRCCAGQRNGAEKTDENVWNTMDGTTQLQFWVTDSSLHLPQQSKRHMLGFYDVSAFISEDEWTIQQLTECITPSTYYSRVLEWYKETIWYRSKKTRDLIVVLSIRYKWRNKMYDVMFYDDEAVDLPCPLNRFTL